LAIAPKKTPFKQGRGSKIGLIVATGAARSTAFFKIRSRLDRFPVVWYM
jgi:hypothetical protein